MIFKGVGFALALFLYVLCLNFLLSSSFLVILQRKLIFAFKIKIIKHWKGNF